ncbi:pilus assembly FimT family protein [Bacterioplanoides sp.]|uniref:pilus assembly FimT family protein n=1 Tax=Bacterioplanoides sp. TaxID=2066072 RepID=UPI003B00C30B
MRQQAFTLIELMVVLAVAAILVATAVPSFSTYLTNKQAASLKSRLTMDIRSARIKADTLDETITILPVNGDWDNGWQIRDSNNVIIKETLLDDLKDVFTSTHPQIQFDRYGRSSNAVTIDIKVPKCSGNNVYKIMTTTLGQVSTGDSTCS